ncbi:MAG: DUF169 domain-containing protein [Syntrophaceae bacterium]
MQPDPARLLDSLGIRIPLIGCYDAPDAQPFAPLVAPLPGKMTCVFAFYEHWLKGETLHITRENFGCAGAGRALCGVTTRSRADLVKFLVDAEGLRASHDLMEAWLDHGTTYRPEYPHLLIGPLKPDQDAFLKTVTFLVNPDQLSALVIGANYHHGPTDPAPVIAPFGAGCMQLLTVFANLATAQAAIGATDIAMRQHLPHDIMAFTVTKPMFAELCGLDEKSFLFKPFWKRLIKARET